MQMDYANSGNITSKTGIGDYTYDSDLPHAVTAVDNSNNLIASDSHSTIFNAFNKIQEISGNGYQLDLVYGPDQQRWKSELRYTGHTIFLSDDSEDCAVMGSADETNAVGPVGPILNGTSRTILYDGNHERVTENNLTRDFYFLDEGVIYVKQNGVPDCILYACCDNLGSYLKLVDDNGTAYFNATYDAWGKQTITQNTIAFHRGYTGHEMLNEFDLINMNGRLYDPLIARFLSPDNYVQLEDFSQSYNRYSYCLNNPLKYTDPSGEFFLFEWTIINAIKDFVVNSVWNVWSQGINAFTNGNNWKSTYRQAQIDMGLYKGDLRQIVSRQTSELFQTTIGHDINSILNTIGEVKSVDYYRGATVVENRHRNWGAFTLGSYILGEEGVEADPANRIFQHEYGHYLQSQAVGPFYIQRYAIPSLIDANNHQDDSRKHMLHPVEQDANSRAYELFYASWNYDKNSIIDYNINLSIYDKKNRKALQNARLSLGWNDYIFGVCYITNGIINVFSLWQ